MNAEVVLFWVFATCTVASAAMVLLARNAIGSAMSLVATFFFLAGIYVLLLAHTIAVLQVLVYAGAVMVLFLFVIMLLALNTDEVRAPWTFGRVIGALSTAGLLTVLVRVLNTSEGPRTPAVQKGLEFGSLKAVGQLMYTGWLFPFEAVSLLLLVAIVGAVVVAKARI